MLKYLLEPILLMEVRFYCILLFILISTFSNKPFKIEERKSNDYDFEKLINSLTEQNLKKRLPSKKSKEFNKCSDKNVKYSFQAIKNCFLPVCNRDELSNLLYETIYDDQLLYNNFIEEYIENEILENLYEVIPLLRWENIYPQNDNVFPQLYFQSNAEQKNYGIQIEPKGEIDMGYLFVGHYYFSSFKVTNLNPNNEIQIVVSSIDRMFLFEPFLFKLGPGQTQVVRYSYFPIFVKPFHYSVIIKETTNEKIFEFLHFKAIIQKNLLNINTIVKTQIQIGKSENVEIEVKNPFEYPIILQCIKKTKLNKWIDIHMDNKKADSMKNCPNITIEKNQIVHLGIIEIRSTERMEFLEVLNYTFQDFEIYQKIIVKFVRELSIISPTILHFGRLVKGRNLPRRIALYCQSETEKKVVDFVFKESPSSNILKNFALDFGPSFERNHTCNSKKSPLAFITFYSQVPGTYQGIFEFDFSGSKVQQVFFI